MVRCVCVRGWVGGGWGSVQNSVTFEEHEKQIDEAVQNNS